MRIETCNTTGILSTLAVCAVLLGGGADRADAQGRGPEILSAAPESPVFAFLGTAPTRVLRPGGVRELGASILSAVGEDGRVRQGFAVEIAPWSLIPGITISLDEYRDNRFKYILANTQVSVGSVRAAGNAASTDVGFGLRLTLVDAADPMRNRNFTTSAASALRRCTENAEATAAQIAACADSTMASLFQAFEDSSSARWNDWALSVGAAAGVRFENSELGRGSSRGVQLWVAGAAPIGKVGHLIGQGGWQHIPATEESEETDLASFGARAIMGASWFGVFGEVVGERRTIPGRSENNAVWSAGAELRVASHLWLTAGLGSRFDAITDEDRTVVIANLRFGVADGTRLLSLRQP